MMGLGIYIIIFVLCFYTIHIAKILLSPKHRENILNKNNKLNKIRSKAVKTIDEQKEFLKTKYPKRKFSKKNIVDVVIDIICFVLLYQVYKHLLSGFDPSMFFTIMFVIIFPFIVNYALSLLNLETNSVVAFFKK